MILSDRSIKEALAAKRIVIEPIDEQDVQPSSVDLHIDRYFRVFRNDTTPYIDPKLPQEDLTEIVEVNDGDAFILHPGEFVLGSTFERVALPDDLVARLEGKSSLGRLGLLIHSSLPASESVFVLEDDGTLSPRPIGEIVAKQLPACVIGFDPQTFAVDYHRITGWYEGPADRIFEVRLASGRSVRVTAGHNLFTLGRDGALEKLRTGELQRERSSRSRGESRMLRPRPQALHVVDLMPEAMYDRFTVSGPSVDRAFARDRSTINELLRDGGWKHTDYYARVGRLPMRAARLVPGLLDGLGPDDQIGAKGGQNHVPAVLPIDAEIAWLLGIYVAEGSRRRNQLTISNTDQAYLDRAQAALAQWGLPVSRAANAITCCSSVASELLGWLGTGEYAIGKRVPPVVFGWPTPLVESFLEGLVDGDGSREPIPHLGVDLFRRPGRGPAGARPAPRPAGRSLDPGARRDPTPPGVLRHQRAQAADRSAGAGRAAARSAYELRSRPEDRGGHGRLLARK